MAPIRPRNRKNFEFYRNQAAELRSQELREIAKKLKPTFKTALFGIPTVVALAAVTLAWVAIE